MNLFALPGTDPDTERDARRVIKRVSAKWPRVIYFMLFDYHKGNHMSLLKIGVTTNLQVRVTQHAGFIKELGLHSLLNLLYIGVDTDKSIGVERVAHQTMKKWRVRSVGGPREWYAAPFDNTDFDCDIEMAILNAKRLLLGGRFRFSIPMAASVNGVFDNGKQINIECHRRL